MTTGRKRLTGALLTAVATAILAEFLVIRPARQARLDHELITAVLNGDETRVGSLLRDGASANARYEWPAKPGVLQYVRTMFTKLHGNGDKYAPSALFMAVDYNAVGVVSIPIVKLLIKYGANVQERDDHGRTALVTMCSEFTFLHGKKEYCDPHVLPRAEIALLSGGADPNARDVDGTTPLFATYDLRAAVALIEKGADVNLRDDNGRTPMLALTTLSSDVALTKLLLEHGADANACRKEGGTCLMMAAGRGSTAQLLELLRHGARVSAKTRHGSTALIGAASNDNLSSVRILLSYGAPVNAADERGWTALVWAARAGSIQCARLLLEHKATVKINSDDGSLLELERRAQAHTAAMERLLIQYGAN